PAEATRQHAWNWELGHSSKPIIKAKEDWNLSDREGKPEPVDLSRLVNVSHFLLCRHHSSQVSTSLLLHHLLLKWSGERCKLTETSSSIRKLAVEGELKCTNDHGCGYDRSPPWETGIDVDILHERLNKACRTKTIVNSQLGEEADLALINDLDYVCSDLSGVGF